MHKIIVWLINQIKNLVQLISIVCSFLTMIISLNWIETIINAHWNWLNFLRPILVKILDFSNLILPFKFNAFGETFDIKYITAIVLMLLVTYICRKIYSKILDIEVDYHNFHIKVKKYNENNFNKNLIKNFNEKEKKVTNYMVLINTQWKKNHFKRENDSIGEQNTIMNDFIFGQTGVKYSAFNNGFLYKFNNFKNIDNILDVMFKVLNAETPLDYAISIQTGDDLQILKKLSDLREFNKIIMTAETLYRYNLNKERNYKTQNVGIFQYERLTLEVHEFKEGL